MALGKNQALELTKSLKLSSGAGGDYSCPHPDTGLTIVGPDLSLASELMLLLKVT